MFIRPPEFKDNLSTYLPHLSNCLVSYRQKYPYCDNVGVYDLLGTNIKIQHYKPGEGFYEWHHENDGRSTINRHLVFMTYLNTLDNGGTDFFHQKITPKKYLAYGDELHIDVAIAMHIRMNYPDNHVDIILRYFYL